MRVRERERDYRWSLDCDHTDAGDPWCVIYDQQHHRIVLHIARIERRYVVVWPWGAPVCGDAEHDLRRSRWR